jgi:hypothetical protein
MGWVDTATAITQLRNLIYDGPQHKLCSQKKVIGVIDGTNTSFKTFEYRRVTDFTTAVSPLGVFLNGAPVTAVTDDVVSGSFTVPSAPTLTGRDVLTATYYYQWFIDSELDGFLQNASAWLGLGLTYINLPDGLNAAAMRFAAQEAYESAAMRFSTRAAEVFKLEDAPSEDILKAIAAFKDMSDSFMSKAETMRDDYYTRQGQAKAPNFGFQLGAVRDPTPRR